MLNTLSPQQVALARMYAVITRFEYQDHEVYGHKIYFSYKRRTIDEWVGVEITLPSEPGEEVDFDFVAYLIRPTPEEESALRCDATRRLAGLLEGSVQ